MITIHKDRIMSSAESYNIHRASFHCCLCVVVFLLPSCNHSQNFDNNDKVLVWLVFMVDKNCTRKTARRKNSLNMPAVCGADSNCIRKTPTKNGVCLQLSCYLCGNGGIWTLSLTGRFHSHIVMGKKDLVWCGIHLILHYLCWLHLGMLCRSWRVCCLINLFKSWRSLKLFNISHCASLLLRRANHF